MSKARQKGTLAETAFVKYLIAHGFPHAERRALHGTDDKGDVTGTVGLAWELKNHKTYQIPQWLKETLAERDNAQADYGFLVIKPNRIGVDNVDQWWVVMDVEQAIALVREAGYGDPL